MTLVNFHDKVVRLSKLLVASYIVDWILVLSVAGIGGGFTKVNGNQNPFALTDLSISYPYQLNETVSTALLVVIGLVIPAAIVLFGSLLIVPTPTALRGTPSALIWRSKVWEWNAGWLGLGVALAGAFMSTEGLKDLAGKPRPDFLARCDPDVTQVAKYMVSGLGEQILNAPILVTVGICRNKGSAVTNDGFASFPSGHSSLSFAGMFYVSLWLCSKFFISFPYLGPRVYDLENPRSTFPQRHSHDSSFPAEGDGVVASSSIPNNLRMPSLRDKGAAPPIYLQILAFIPICVASFVAISRWFNHRHHGFDILFGSALGIAFAYIGFRIYHVPIGQSDGWAWAARSRRYALFRGIGYTDHIARNGWAGEDFVKDSRIPSRADDVAGEGRGSSSPTEGLHGSHSHCYTRRDLENGNGV